MSEKKQATSAAKGFSNPALRAMGIPTIKLPSRNWMIFWSLLTVTVSGIAYDKYEQRQIVKRYCESVQYKSKLKLDTNRVPRKITVFIAPPPNDYLETSLKVWRRYIKPVLYHAGLDYDIIEEDKQGLIRTHVANQIRQVRREYLIEQQEKEVPVTDTEDKEKDGIVLDDGKDFKKKFDYRNLLGIFYQRPKMDKIINTDSEPIDPTLSGGVICLGRGAYKEYINGLHEGLLGPLDALPATKVEDIIETDADNLEGETAATMKEEITDTLKEDSPDEFTENKSNNKEEEEAKASEDKPKDHRVLPRFISPQDYQEAPIADEIIKQLPIMRSHQNHVPILLHQPILMIPVPNLSGFTTIPQRIIRFYQRRFYTETVCSQVTHLVNQDSIRPFKDPADRLIGVEEEEDWPHHWVKQGLKKNSEWVQPLKSDKRVTQYISVLKQDYDKKE